MNTIFGSSSCLTMDLSSVEDSSTHDSDAHSELRIDDVEDDISVADSPKPLPNKQSVIERTHVLRTACNSNFSHLKSDGNNRKWLLTAVRRIREQKQRPNVSRIMNQLRILCPGRFTSSESVVEQLEEAVDDGDLIRVGPPSGNDCSYRDPGRVVKLKTHALEISQSVDLTKVVARCVRDLADPHGSTPGDIFKYIRLSYAVKIIDDTDLLGTIVKACKSAVKIGKLLLADGESDRYCTAAPVAKSVSTSNIRNEAAIELVDRAFTSEVNFFLVSLMMKLCVI
jgi:hypothetical protein